MTLCQSAGPGPERPRAAVRGRTRSPATASAASRPSDVIEDVIARAASASTNAASVVVEPLYEQARAEADAASARLQARARRRARLFGVPVTIKDLVYVAGVPARGGAPANEGFAPDRRRRRRGAAARGGRHRHGQDHHLRIRLQAHRRQPCLRRHPQPLAARPHQRRLQRRRGGGRGGGMRAARHRHRRRRLHPRARPASAACSASSRRSASCRARRASRRRPGARWPIPAPSPARWRMRP